jgi:hypothetical protein
MMSVIALWLLKYHNLSEVELRGVGKAAVRRQRVQLLIPVWRYPTG